MKAQDTPSTEGPSYIAHADNLQHKPQGQLADVASITIATTADQQLYGDGDVSEVRLKPRGVTNDLPIAVDGPPLPDEIPLPIDYTLVLDKGKSIRGYQNELAQPGKEGKNYIVVAPTGSGKTLVAALVISHHLQIGKERGEMRKVVFIVEKRPLAQQQTKELQRFIPAAKVSCCIGDDTNNCIRTSIADGHHIIVCTAGKLLDDQKCGRISLADFSLVVFDECHHTRKKSPYAGLMIRYIQMKSEEANLPQVMGLTASPGAGDNPHVEKTVTIDHLVKLCALMDATNGIKMVRMNKGELEEHTNKPDYNLENSKDRESSEPFIVNVVELMQELETKVSFTCPFDRWSQKYETQVQQKKFALEKSADPTSRDFIRIWELLRCLSRALDVYMELQYKDAMSVLNDSSIRKLEEANEFEMKLRTSLNSLIATLEGVTRVENPHLLKVKSILEERFVSDPQSKVMLFVRTKKHASSIFYWVQSLPTAEHLGIHPCMVVGQEAGITGDGMTQAEQENSFQTFRDGRSNLLVVTSIGEEGIDIPACNLVIRYQHVSNEIAKAQTLGRARATGKSEGYTILSSTSKQRQEVMNGELLALVDNILLDAHFPTGRTLRIKIEKEQEMLLKKEERDRAMANEQKSTYKVEDVHLLCITCKAPACCAADIRVLNGNCHVVPGEEFQCKIKKIEHPKPVYKLAMNKTHRILCKKCGHSWGNSCIWPCSGNQFPVLSCKSFTFIVGENPITVKKWSAAPFDIHIYSD